MPKKSFVTSLPDKAGAFLQASRIVAEQQGNIIRVSYNKAVDLHMLFLEVEAAEESLCKIEQSLADIGYIHSELVETRVIEIAVKIPDQPGAVLPVLEVLNRSNINISYLNSCAAGEPYQYFRLGLLIEDPRIIKTLLDEISGIYPVDIVECDSSEENLDNTVFYIRLANEMKTLLCLNNAQTISFITESNRILQALQTGGEDAGKVFAYIRRFAHFVSSYRGENYKADVQTLSVNDDLKLYSIQPPCGSNTYVLKTPAELVLIDTGYAAYAQESVKELRQLFPDWNNLSKKLLITHADVDHCGLLASLTDVRIIVNRKSYESFQRQIVRLPDDREKTELHLGYSRISQIISGYTPPDIAKLEVLDTGTPEEHENLIQIGSVMVDDYEFTVYEGSGGHLRGEMVYTCARAGLIFTGDLLVNIGGFSKERAEFNSLAPFLMKSVNVDSVKATAMRKQVIALIEEISRANNKHCVVCGGHGPLSVMRDGVLINL